MAIFEKLCNYKDTGLVLMRMGIGFMMITHGLPKLTGGPETWGKLGASMENLDIHFAPAFWGFMAAASEGIGGILIILGLFFRPACLCIMLTMGVAASDHFSSGDGLKGAGHALELAFTFLGLLFIGPGKYSVDKK